MIETFVDAAPLLASVSTTDHQVIFGRRGTGKTHILKYLDESVRGNGDIAVYIDLRSVGSNNSIYGDYEKTQSQRATPLLLDVLGALHDALVTVAVDLSEQCNLSIVGPRLDKLADAISVVEVIGPVERTDSTSTANGRSGGLSVGLQSSLRGVSASVKAESNEEASQKAERVIKRTGSEQFYVKFGTVQSELAAVASLLGNRRIWLLLDEWSEIPADIQPYLADLLRRCILPIAAMTVKIAAIEHRSNFSIRRESEYTGIELGADAGADVNLDDFMVFDNDAARSTKFFGDLLYKHYRASDGLQSSQGPQSSEQLINQTFTQFSAFEEFVRSVEGVPRDAVYLASTVARRAYNRQISINDVRAAARDWYQRDKATAIKQQGELSDLLDWIINEVIGHRRARAFLLKAYKRHPLIDTLFDSRLLHILKKNISSRDNPGERYDVYKLDYGCYVDLITGSRSPLGLLPAGDNDTHEFVDVPPDDYRSIRRAILDLDQFEQRHPSLHEVGESTGKVTEDVPIPVIENIIE